MAFGDLIKSDTIANISLTTFSPDLGANPASGSLLIATVSSGDASANVSTPPSGFTLLHASTTGSGTWYWYYKLSVGTEQTISATWDIATNGVMLYVEYEWDGSTPAVTKNQNTDNISVATNSQPSGAATPPQATNLCIALHATDGNAESFDAQAVDGAWIEDFAFFDNDVSQGQGKLSRLVNAALSSQEATHIDTDTGEQMFGAIAIFVDASAPPPPAQGIFTELIGYGSLATGGKDGTVVTVTNTNDTGGGSLRQAIADASGSTWIVFSIGLTGTITLATLLRLKPNMTIDGRGANITIDADKISGETNDTNLILLYLKHTGTTGAGDDCWQADMDGSPGQGNWWVHHCDFKDAFDECIGITNAVSDWTISYTKLESLSGAGKAMLAGGSDADPTTMWGTMHHNWINALERLPRTRRVKLHYYNNFVEGWTSDNPAVNIGDNGQCLFEKCVADANGTGSVALDQESADPNPGFTKSIGPHHLLSSATVVENTPGSVFDPSTEGPTGIVGYVYTAEDANAALKTALEAEAGWQDVTHPGFTAPWDFVETTPPLYQRKMIGFYYG